MPSPILDCRYNFRGGWERMWLVTRTARGTRSSRCQDVRIHCRSTRWMWSVRNTRQHLRQGCPSLMCCACPLIAGPFSLPLSPRFLFSLSSSPLPLSSLLSPILHTRPSPLSHSFSSITLYPGYNSLLFPARGTQKFNEMWIWFSRISLDWVLLLPIAVPLPYLDR